MMSWTQEGIPVGGLHTFCVRRSSGGAGSLKDWESDRVRQETKGVCNELLNQISQNKFAFIGRAGIDFYADPQEPKQKRANAISSPVWRSSGIWVSPSSSWGGTGFALCHLRLDDALGRSA